ncbi:uncharacterized protein LOC133191091 [Saccostrea echinata]|uniref:uncharacterized protein LOC133191091 n=1 Tax=Saccostrea echinata TaxID=191078 RepID=UPI002A8047BC|nr:uncharacterized protein LOC133191091 [Saccostrea echinata]
MLNLKPLCYHCQRICGRSFRLCSSRLGSHYKDVHLPDYNTSVDINSHRLTRPKKPPPTPKWEGLQTLAERTKGSLIPETLKAMEEDEDFKLTAAKIKEMGTKKLTKEERKRRQRALTNLNVPDFEDYWKLKRAENDAQHIDTEDALNKKTIEVLQANIGLYCNQACNHCHVESSPRRKEMMSHEVAERCLNILKNSPSIHTLDLTGGAPELLDQFRYLVSGGRKLGKKIIVRSNLTVHTEPGQEDTAEFMKDHQVNIVASLPCYTAKNVNQQRGKGVFDRSIQALIKFNSLGYGEEGSGLKLDLVYNPLGAFLPPPQGPLEDKYRQELMEFFGIKFNQLFTITNMPIKRFADFLYRRNELESYMELLVRNYNIHTLDKLMCRNLINVNWNGKIYDCDFNQQLEMGITKDNTKDSMTVFDILSARELEGVHIQTDSHCYGCTAGMGSS